VAATHLRTCNLCEALCGVAIDVEDGRIRSIRGDEEDVFSRGHICPKAVALQDLHEDPDRLRRPMRRRGAAWEEVGWDDALEEAAERLTAVQDRHGRHAVAVYQGNPVVHAYGLTIFGQFLLRALRTRSRFSATSVDQLPHMLASLLMFGHQLRLPVPDVDRTQHFLVLGANPLASNGSLMTAPGIARRLQALRARGGRLVVVDPRRTETAAVADQHVPIRPGTDALLLLGMIHTLFATDRVRPGRLAALTDGVDTMATLVREFAPEVVAAPTGVPAEVVRRLATELADSPAGACYGRVGVSTQEFGGLACWLINVVNVLVGSLDRPGGVMFARPAADVVSLTARLGQQGHFDKGRSRVRGLPEFGGEWPASTLAEEIETDGPGQIRGLVTIAGNPVLSTPNGGRLDRALERLDFMLAVDPYRNETTRHAHLILPPPSPLERDHFDLILHALAVRNTARYSPALFTAPPDARQDWQILADLAGRIQRRRRAPFSARVGLAAARRLGPRGIVDFLLRTGPYGAWRRGGRGLSLAALEKAPHGIDLGPLTEALPDALETPGRRIVLAPPRLVADLDRLRAHAAALAADGASLRLIGRRDLRSNNSWMHNSERLVKGPERCTLLMHPDDARRRGLAAGDRVEVRSRAGAVEVPLAVTDAVMPGVVSLPHGWGHSRPGIALSVAAARPGASLNDVTDEMAVDALAGTAALNGVVVEVVGARRRAPLGGARQGGSGGSARAIGAGMGAGPSDPPR
jgi:anaerobic selenocysteine-containing dehydrogenase